MGAPVVHFEINARNAKQAQKFYSQLFGWKIDARNPIGYGLVDTGVKMGINGGIAQAEGEKPFVTFYVQVEKLQRYLDKAVRLGAKVVVPVTVIPNMVTFALFADPDGNFVGIVEGPQTTRKGNATRGKKRSRK
jgi:predicted enzyme related to lactoylglutathione lyase